MAMTERGGMITIEGEDLILRKVIPEGPDMALLEVEDPEDEEEREYRVFPSSERAGELAAEAVKEDMLWGIIDSPDPAVQARAAAEAVERLGAENLVRWALGLEAGPGYTKVTSLQAWFDLYKETPWEHWAPEDDTEADIEPHDDDYTEARILIGASVWDNMVEQLGWEPEVAYRTS